MNHALSPIKYWRYDDDEEYTNWFNKEVEKTRFVELHVYDFLVDVLRIDSGRAESIIDMAFADSSNRSADHMLHGLDKLGYTEYLEKQFSRFYERSARTAFLDSHL